MNNIVYKAKFPGLDGTGCSMLIPSRRQDGASRYYQDMMACGLPQNEGFETSIESFSDSLEKMYDLPICLPASH